MAIINIDFDFKISIIQPELSRGLPSSSKDKLTQTGEFIYKAPEQVNPTFAAVQSNIRPVEENTQVKDLLSDLSLERDQINRFIDILSKRCKHLVATYNPNLKKDEAITDACQKIFEDISGRITYSMYARAIDTLQQLELFMGHRTIQNEGILDGA